MLQSELDISSWNDSYNLRAIFEEVLMKKERRNHSRLYKVKILRRHLVDKVRVPDLYDEFGLHPPVFCRW